MEPILNLDRQVRATRSQLGVRNRQPQGQLVPFPIAGAGVFDEDDSFDLYIRIPARIYVLVEVVVELYFKQFFAPATAAASGGGATSGSGGSSTPTSSSGGGRAPTTSSGPHVHAWAVHESDTPGSFTNRRWQEAYESGVKDFNLPTSGTGELWTSGEKPSAHSHTVTIAAHTHTVTIGDHTHSTPAHGHGLTYGVFKEAMPATHDVAMGLYRRVGSSWELITTVSGLTADIEDVNLTQWLDGPGSWRLSLESVPGQPNGGRLGVDVAGSVLGAIKSA